MNHKLFTLNFIKVCFANLFLFFSLYMVLPITPFELTKNLNLENYANWYFYLTFILGLLVGGPFHNYFIENYNRKKICSLSYIGVIIPSLLFIFTDNQLFYLIGAFVQGFSFGTATAGNVTIAIDVTLPQKRGKGNIIYAWAGRSGMVLAIPLSIYIQLTYGYHTCVYISILTGVMAYLFTKLTKHPFRAPNDVKALSLDRFILPQGWRLMLMMIAIAFIPGSLFPHFMQEIQTRSFYITADTTIFIVLPFFVFIISALLSRLEIDALLHNKVGGYLLTRLPLLLIGSYFLVEYYKSLSSWSILISLLLIIGFIFAIWTSIMPHRRYPKMSKWVLESQYRMEVTSPIFSGILCIILSLLLENDLYLSDYISYILITQLLLFGLARVSSPIFLLLILSSKHCERGTANTSHHLAWEVGLALGAIITLAYHLSIQETIILNASLVGVILLLYLYIHYRLHYLARHKH